MAERFNLTAQLHLQAPRNVGQVVGQIRRQLHGINANVNVKGDARTIAKVNKELRSVDKHARSSAASVGRLNRNLSEAARRFSVITVATGTMLAFAHAVKNAVGEAISFERELVKISQVSGKSVRNLQGLTKEITRLSTSLGASSADLLSVSRTLTQAGFSAQKTKQALDILAKTSLGATFDDIKNTTEGAIAVLRQFRAEAQRTGGDIKFLEQTMDAINAVSKRFAVESNDLISVIRRVGGVFETAGGSVNELIALFTSVRATTRETAETIATGLRTIFTRIQRTETVDQLRQLGIELRNAQGQFVGSYEAVRRLSEGLAGLDPRDYRFSQIVEQLGGFRQIGKVIPLIRQFTTAQEALNVAQAASGSVTRDAITAQQSLAVQAAKVREEFSALMRNLADSSTFRSIANGALELAKAFIKVTEAIKPVLPMLTLMIGMKIGRALAPGLGAIAGVGRGRATGGKIHKFSTGGFVPGVGNSDSVPAYLQPGEFVIKKSSAQKLGAGNLHAMNKYAAGGVVTRNRGSYGSRPMGVPTIARTLRMNERDVRSGDVDALRKQAEAKKLEDAKTKTTKGQDAKGARLGFQVKKGQIGGFILRPAKGKDSTYNFGGKNFQIQETDSYYRKASKATGIKKGPIQAKLAANAFPEFYPGMGTKDLQGFKRLARYNRAIKQGVLDGMGASLGSTIDSVKKHKLLDIPPAVDTNESLIGSALANMKSDKGMRQTMEGYLFEGMITALTGAVAAGGPASFDFPSLSGKKSKLVALFGDARINSLALAEAKRSRSGFIDADSGVVHKTINNIRKNNLKGIQKMATGGQVDSVPAMLTPGEYVINRSSAQAIGYSNLNKMNKTGVQHFARGGMVQHFKNGGPVLGTHSTAGVGALDTAVIEKVNKGYNDLSRQLRADIADMKKRGVSSEKIEAANKQLASQRKIHVATIKNLITQGKNEELTSKKLENARAKLAQQTKAAGAVAGKGGGGGGLLAGAKAVGGKVLTGAKSMGGQALQGVKSVEGTAAAMQQFVFLGGAVTAVTAQMSSLSDTTKQAINETAGFTVGMVGIAGTLIQTITSLISSEAAETTSNIGAKVSEDTESAANMRNAGLAGGLANGLNVFLVTVTAAIVALKFWSASAKATADEANKKWTSALDKIQKEGGGDAGAISANIKAEMKARSEAAARFNAGSAKLVAGWAGAGAAIGAFMGPVGGALGALVGAAIGVGAALWRTSEDTKRAAIARQNEVDAINKSVEGFIKLVNAQKTLEDSFADIDAAGLSPEREVQLKLRRLGESGRVDTVGQGREAEARIAQIAQRLGATSAEVRATGGKSEKLQALAEKKGKKGRDAQMLATTNAAPLQVAMKRLEAANSFAASRAKLSAQVYAKAADGLRGASNFGELRKALPQFAAAMNARTKAIQESAALELAAARRAVSDAKTAPEKAEAEKNVKKIQSALANRLKLQREADKKLVQSVRKRIKEDLLAAKAAEALRKEMVATNKFMRDLGAIAASQAKQEKRLKNEAALVENKQLDFSVEQTTGIADLTMVGDLKKFEKELRSSIRNLPPTMRAKANDMVDGVVSTTKLINVAKEKMVGQGIKRGATVPTADEVLKAAGLDPSKVDGDIKRGMTKSIEEAFKTDRTISAEDFDKIFDPLIKEGQAQAKALSSVQQKYNKAVSLHTQSLNTQQMVLEKRTAAELRLVEIANKNEVMLAKARGMDDAAIGKILDRQERKTAQVSLAGTGVRAGDLGGAVKAREAAQQRREQIAREIRNSNLSLVARKKLMTEDRKMSIVISRTTGEIKRLGDQSEKAGRLMDQIDAERAKREVLTGLVTDFVVGGQEERKAMQKSFMGIQFAMATGTLQTQSPEQRQATVGMLDTLADIEIPGAGGMTGKEVKQKLVFDDAVRMGLDPKIAQQLAKATSKEEKLITALEKLTVVMEKANKVEAEGKAMGGLVHLAGGGSTIFKPRGTDTVPAMLTPGEFVIKKSSVDKYGTGMMSAINAGRFAKGGVVYAKDGTKVPPIDDRAYYESRQHGGFGTFGGVNLYKVKTSARSGTIVIPEMFRQLFNRGTPGSAPVFSKSRVSKDAYSAYRRLQGRAGRYPIQAALGLAPDTSRGPRELDPKLAAAHEKYKRPFDPSQFMSLGPAPVDPEIEAYRRRLRKRDAMTNAKKKLAGLPDRFAGLRDRFMATNFMADNQFGSGVGGRFLTGFRSAGKRARFLKKLEEQQAAFGSGVPKGPASMPTLLMGAPKFTSFGGRDPAVQASIDRANREEALFKAQQARQAPAQPAQTRGMPFALRSQESFDRVKQQRDKRHRIIASRQPRRYRDNHYNNPNSPYYRMTLDQALKKQKADKIIKSRARDKRMARQQRLQMRYGQRFADGGQVDSVPAMLTPGEFVMSRGAVQRYGTGFMSSLNRGNVPGFNSGGFVGAKYLQNGSTSAVKRGGGFNFDSLAGMLDTMTKAFPTLNSVITKLQNVFSDLNMTHNFKGDMSLAFSITNADSLKQSVADAITPHISDLITRELDNRLGGFNATGP